MRRLRATFSTALPLVIVCLWLGPLPAAEPGRMNTLDDAAVHRLLVAEIKAALDGSRRLAPLPRNVSTVVIGPEGEPCFVVPAINVYRQDSLATAVTRAAREEPGFRLLWEARSLGTDADKSLVLTAGPDATVAVIDGGTSRTVSLPRVGQPERAMRIGKRWVFLTSAGLVAEGEAVAWDGSAAFAASPWTRVLRSGDDGLVVLDMQQRTDAGQIVKRGVRTGDAWKIDTFALPGTEFWRTAVRLNDGRWLAIGQHIVEVRDDRPPRPTEQQLKTALDAARAGDWPALEKVLETISSYPSNETMGLVNLMQALPDRGLPLRNVCQLLDNAQGQLARAQATDGLAPDQAARVADLLAACEAQLRATTAALAEAVPDLLARAPGAIAARLRSGMQLYRGRWISVIDVLRQDGVDSALLVVRLGDDSRGGGTSAVARLESDGSLRIVQELPGNVAPGHGSGLFATGTDTVYAVLPGRGLVSVSAAGTTWVETRGRLRGLLQVVGVDGRGRIYLRQTRDAPQARDGAESDVLWVLTPDVAAVEPEPVVEWPVIGQPTVDADGSIWFLRPTIPDVHYPGGPTVPAAVQPGVEIRRVELQPVVGAEQPAGDVPRRPGAGGEPQLCRLKAAGTMVEYGLAPSLGATGLTAGRNAVWGDTQRGRADEQTVMIAADALVRGKDLHALAETAFETVLAAAPEAVLPGAWRGATSWDGQRVQTQLLRTADLLWVNAAGRIEVYARGRPLAVDERLALRGLRSNAPRMVGPLRSADGRLRVLVAAAPGNVQQFVWITANEQGLEIEPAGPAPAWPDRGVPEYATEGLPLVAADRSSVFVNQRVGRVLQIMGPQAYRLFGDAGAPFLAIPGGDGFLAWRPQNTRLGVRVCTAAERRDVPVLFTGRLEPVAFEAEGRLLCLQPDGLAWLEPDPREGYVVAATRRLPDGFTPTGHLGRMDDAEVITANDWRQQPHVLVVPVAQR